MPNDEDDLFNKLKRQLLMIDPVSFVEHYLTLDGKPFTLQKNGYKPFSDIYRYVGIKSLELNAKPVIIVKGRQVGATTMASALEMYFMGSGIFGTGNKPPIRVMHTFPQLELAAAYSKTKLNQIIISSIPSSDQEVSKSSKPKSHMQSLLDKTNSTNDSLHFKQFINGNHLWIESTGIDSDRIMGRQLCLETELPTPNGLIKLKDLKEGDQLFDEKGDICNVTKLFPIDYSPESYKITFDDGTIVDACAEHLWLTYTKADRIAQQRFIKGTRSVQAIPEIKNTKEILQTLKIGKELNHSIPNTLPINYPKRELIVDPYLLGLWLGDGDRYGKTEIVDPEILEGFNYLVSKYSINRFSNFSNNKYIPEEYMRSSFEQRLALLQGLLDIDGHCDKNGNIEFVQVSKELAIQVYDLVLSLGIKAFFYKRENWRYSKRYQDKYRVRFITNLPVFRIKRKLARVKNNITTKSSHRFIANIELIEPKPMRCITVDSKSHLYLITKQYISTHNTCDVIIFDEVQKTTGTAIGNALKILTTAKYGKKSKGVQIYFGTPRRKGSDFNKMWQISSQQYYYLGCEKCEKHFPLYTPESDDWKNIWIHGYIVKCTNCGHEQNKLEAAERGKWIALKDSDSEDCDMIGFHINQLYMPMFTREDIDKEMPGIHPINTQRVFMNEVLGEFFQGDSSPITPEEIKENCADAGRKFSARIVNDPNNINQEIVVLGIDYGARADLEQLANPDKVKVAGQSYSTAVVLVAKGPGLLSIEFATKFKRNDMESKKGIIDQIMRQYSVQLAIGDIGYSNDFSALLHQSYGDRYLVSRAHNKVNGHVKFSVDAFPKEIVFERDHYIGELYEQMKKGMVRFPYGDYEKIAWLIEHCSSMEIKPSISRVGHPSIHYVKGSTQNDGFMALLNAYIAYKFIISKGFTSNNPLLQQQNFKERNKPLITGGYISRKF